MKPKVLLFVDWYLPGYKAGGPIRSIANLTAHLKNEIDFYIVTSDTDYHSATPYSSVTSNTWTLLEEGIQVMYLSRDHEKIKYIREILLSTSFDVLYLNSMFSFRYSLIPLWLSQRIKKENFSIVLAPRGMLAAGALSIKSRKKKTFLRALQYAGLMKKVIFHATSKEECKDIERFFDSKVLYAPGLPKPIQASSYSEKAKRPDTLKLINVARISPEKNLLFALELLKQVDCPLSLDIYGTINDVSYWKQCQQAIAQLPSFMEIQHKGEITPDVLAQTWQHYHFLLLTTLGENYGHAIIEALSAGCPVIISDRTPWRNLNKLNVGWDLPLEDPKQFIETIKDCYKMGTDEYIGKSKQAFIFAQSVLNDQQILDQNKALFIGVH